MPHTPLVRRHAIRWVGVTCAALAIAVGVAPPSQAAPHRTGPSLTMVLEDRELIDLGTPGASKGDVTVGSGSAMNRDKSERLGSYSYTATTVVLNTTTDRDERDLSMSVSLPKGDLFLLGHSSGPIGKRPEPGKQFAYAVVGGTRAYAGVSGEAISTFVSSNESTLVFHLVRP